jgi:hypothetical protein
MEALRFSRAWASSRLKNKSVPYIRGRARKRSSISLRFVAKISEGYHLGQQGSKPDQNGGDGLPETLGKEIARNNRLPGM